MLHGHGPEDPPGTGESPLPESDNPSSEPDTSSNPQPEDDAGAETND